MGAGRQVLDLRHAVQRVVERLADHGPVDARRVAKAADLRQAPGAEVGDAEMADLAGPHEVRHGAHRLLQRRRVVLLVQIEDVDRLHAQAAQAGLGGQDAVAARQAAVVGALPRRIGELGGQHPPLALAADQAAGDLLGTAVIVDIRRVDEVDPGLPRTGCDAPGDVLLGGAAEHHGAEAERRHLQAAAAEPAIFHGNPPPCRAEAILGRTIRNADPDLSAILR